MQAGTNVQRPEKKSLNHLLNFQADHGKKTTTQAWEHNMSVKCVMQTGSTILLTSPVDLST